MRRRHAVAFLASSCCSLVGSVMMLPSCATQHVSAVNSPFIGRPASSSAKQQACVIHAINCMCNKKTDKGVLLCASN